MKVQLSEEAQRILVILKLDAKRVFERIKYRETEYLNVFSMKRTRAHFPEIFKNRYDAVTARELMQCSEEVIVGLDQFYSKIDEIKWYLNVTEDMPSKVSDKMRHHIKELENYFQMLTLYIDAELGLEPNNKKAFEASAEEENEPDPYTFTATPAADFSESDE